MLYVCRHCFFLPVGVHVSAIFLYDNVVL